MMACVALCSTAAFERISPCSLERERRGEGRASCTYADEPWTSGHASCIASAYGIIFTGIASLRSSLAALTELGGAMPHLVLWLRSLERVGWFAPDAWNRHVSTGKSVDKRDSIRARIALCRQRLRACHPSSQFNATTDNVTLWTSLLHRPLPIQASHRLLIGAHAARVLFLSPATTQSQLLPLSPATTQFQLLLLTASTSTRDFPTAMTRR